MDKMDEHHPPTRQDLNRAILSRDFDVAKQLIAGGMDVSYGEFQPLRLAVMVGNMELAQILIPMADDEAKIGAFMTACDNGQANVLKVLMDCVNTTPDQQHEAFNRAFQRGKHECVIALWEGRDRKNLTTKSC